MGGGREEIPLQSFKGKCIKDSSENKVLQFWWPYKYVVLQARDCYCNTNIPQILVISKVPNTVLTVAAVTE